MVYEKLSLSDRARKEASGGYVRRRAEKNSSPQQQQRAGGKKTTGLDMPKGEQRRGHSLTRGM